MRGTIARSCAARDHSAVNKNKKDNRLTDQSFLSCVEKIGKTIAKEENGVRVGMGGALVSIGATGS